MTAIPHAFGRRARWSVGTRSRRTSTSALLVGSSGSGSCPCSTWAAARASSRVTCRTVAGSASTAPLRCSRAHPGLSIWPGRRRFRSRTRRLPRSRCSMCATTSLSPDERSPRPAGCFGREGSLRSPRRVATTLQSSSHAFPRTALTFDAELAPELLAGLFTDVEVERWDAPLLELPTRAAVRDFLIAKGVEQAAAESRAGRVEVPFRVTKRGALAFARKR